MFIYKVEEGISQESLDQMYIDIVEVYNEYGTVAMIMGIENV
ncbi:MAG: hypothetical protein ACTH0S_06665 [Senegalia sp. (in: firmicutes)]